MKREMKPTTNTELGRGFLLKKETLAEKGQPSITVIDSIMGSGKTTYMINVINKNPELRYIFISKYLSEVDRIIQSCKMARFQQPEDIRYGSKAADFHWLLNNSENIAMTHELYRRLSLTQKEREAIKAAGYRLIIDEVLDVLEPMEVSKADMKVILERYVAVDERGGVQWIDREYSGKHSDLKQRIEGRNVICLEKRMLIWLLPIELLQAFSDIDIMTFLFEGSYMKAYLDLHQMSYEVKYIANHVLVPGRQRLVQHLAAVSKQIDIYEGRLNDVGELPNTLSSTWFKAQKNCKQVRTLELNARNYLSNKCKAKADEAMWTRFKPRGNRKWKPSLSERYTTSFCPCNASATNEYRKRRYLAYLINVFENPMVASWFKKQGIATDPNAYALSQMLQWIWRSAIRDGKEISIYIPSPRMRGLLRHFLRTGVVANETVAKKVA